MNKKDYIEKYGEAAYDKVLKQSNEWIKNNPEKAKTRGIEWRRVNPEKVKETNEEQSRKGGRYYDYKREYNKTGIPGEKNKIRIKHANV